MNPIQDGLQQIHGNPVSSHRIREDEAASWLQKARHFPQYTSAITGMKNGILTPDQVSTTILKRYVFKRGGVHGDLLAKAGLLIEATMPLVLDVGDVHGMDMTRAETGESP